MATRPARERDLPLVIDEFQKAPPLLDAIRISESLTGRAERVHLWTLSQGEFRGHRESFLSDLLGGHVPRSMASPRGAGR